MRASLTPLTYTFRSQLLCPDKCFERQDPTSAISRA